MNVTGARTTIIEELTRAATTMRGMATELSESTFPVSQELVDHNVAAITSAYTDGHAAMTLLTQHQAQIDPAVFRDINTPLNATAIYGLDELRMTGGSIPDEMTFTVRPYKATTIAGAFDKAAAAAAKLPELD